MREIGRSPLLLCSKGSLTTGFSISQPAAMAALVPRAALHVPRKKSPTQVIGLQETSEEHLINEFFVWQIPDVLSYLVIKCIAIGQTVFLP